MIVIRSKALGKPAKQELIFRKGFTQYFQMIKDLIKETLRPNGKWSMKRIGAFTSFWAALGYAILPLFRAFKVHEFVFVGLLTYSATALGLTVWSKSIKGPKI